MFNFFKKKKVQAQIPIRHEDVSLMMEAFSTDPMSMSQWAIKVNKGGIYHTDNLVVSARYLPGDSLRSVSNLAKENDFFSLKQDYQWGGSGAGGIRITLQIDDKARNVTVYGPQYWADKNNKDIPPEVRAAFQEEVLRFFTIWDYMVDTLQPAVVSGRSRPYRIPRFVLK
jgi:hypothetical protein